MHIEIASTALVKSLTMRALNKQAFDFLKVFKCTVNELAFITVSFYLHGALPTPTEISVHKNGDGHKVLVTILSVAGKIL
jgi:hypothetical protein